MRKKGTLPTKPKFTVTKRGCYMDDIFKRQKGLPGPNKYDLKIEWVSKKDIEKGKKRPTKTVKNTFLD